MKSWMDLTGSSGFIAAGTFGVRGRQPRFLFASRFRVPETDDEKESGVAAPALQKYRLL